MYFLFLIVGLVFFAKVGDVLGATSCSGTYSCGACYQGMQLCTSGASYCPGGTGNCPPYTAVYCYDYQRTCTGALTPTVILNQCGPGYYGCNQNSQPGYCCPVGVATPVPTSGPGGPGCTPNCGGAYCAWKDNGCGANCACNECETCTLKCGQAKDCGGSCTSTDSGVPGTVSIVSPNGSIASPTITGDNTPALQWGAVGGLADRYFIEMLDSTNAVVWSRYVNTIGTTGVDTGITLTAGQVYHWHIRAENTTCSAQVGAWSTSGYVKLNSLPTITCVVHKNSNGVNVAWEAGNMDHIMNNSFTSTALPRRVSFQVCVNDVDGFADISSAKMQWNGNTYNMTIGAGSGTGATASVTVDFVAGDNGTAALPLSFDAKDVTTAANPVSWTASGYSFKVWSGNVAVNGNMYDSSDSPLGAQCPTGEGFNTLATAAMNFNYADFTPTVGTLVRVNATTDSAYSGGSLTWGKTYTAAPNADVVGGTILNRWIDLGVGTTSCGTQLTINNTITSPYAASPSLKVDFSTASAQPAWFQVSEGGIQAVGSITAMIPTTCRQDATCVGAMAKTNNTMISAASISNGGCLLGDTGCQYGNPNNWYRNNSTLSSAEKYDYRYFYDRYFIGYGGGITLPANATMTTVKADGGAGVFFINGDFTVNENNTVPVGQSLIVIAKGKIFFSQAVTQAQGIFIADSGMLADGTNAGALNISGSLYSASSTGDITFTRAFANPLDNNNKPAVLVTYRPDIMFNLPGSLLKVLSGWRQN